MEADSKANSKTAFCWRMARLISEISGLSAPAAVQGDLRAPKSADTHWRSHDRQATPVLSPEFLSSVFSTVHIGVLNLYLKMSPTALFYWTWPLLFYYWCCPMGTKRGITGASTWFILPPPLSLSPEGPNCWSQGWERPESTDFFFTNKHSTHKQTTQK